MGGLLQRGLFWRVYLTLLGALVLVALLGAIFFHGMAHQSMSGTMSYPSATLGALLPGPGAAPVETARAIGRLSAALHRRVTLLDASGAPLASAADGAPVSAAQEPAHDGGVMRVWRIHLPDGRRLLIEELLWPRGSGAQPGPHILIMLLAVAGAVGVAAFPLVSRLTGRLERLQSSLDAWGGGRLDVRAAVEGRDEIAAVAASFNTAADQVEALLAAHKALLAHASHELRSPLARLRMAVELFVQNADPGLRPAIVADIAELDALVEEILLASRLDNASDLPERERVDLLALAAEEAARAGAELQPIDASAVFEVEGSARWLRRMIRNLIENAGKHGQPPVEVELTRPAGSAGAITITVRDRGPGIPEAERERVFEPFYRPKGHAEAAGSWGLGLSIVRQIAERHGGRVFCRAGAEGGRFVVEMPSAVALR